MCEIFDLLWMADYTKIYKLKRTNTRQKKKQVETFTGNIGRFVAQKRRAIRKSEDIIR